MGRLKRAADAAKGGAAGVPDMMGPMPGGMDGPMGDMGMGPPGGMMDDGMDDFGGPPPPGMGPGGPPPF